jgi:hypothetical protein
MKPDRALTAPVQCRVHPPYNSLLVDQQLKYGSCVTSGAAGGRNAWARPAADTHAITNVVAAARFVFVIIVSPF